MSILYRLIPQDACVPPANPQGGLQIGDYWKCDHGHWWTVTATRQGNTWTQSQEPPLRVLRQYYQAVGS